MAAQSLNLTNFDSLTNKYAIEQGATFDWLTFSLDGDYSSWMPRGEIRDNYASAGGIVKASFIFLPLEVIRTPDDLKTLIRPRLSAQQTQSLDWYESGMNSRTAFGEPAIPGQNVWVYDIEIEGMQGEVKRILQGYVEVSLEATR